ncbi:hypothetical protein GMOD_00001494 [Pyrenophora seminiperda CCB06]|uniref:Uncharacterized protein n=1 Tax=Pyrenophora seminiperda CCB06 TaxID=1302712 RepID=A0A3M7LZ66_9PLEO|nr:hypothetical protein GMOD_00001494 [Pyrenophora seminiperda CCB06]
MGQQAATSEDPDSHTSVCTLSICDARKLLGYVMPVTELDFWSLGELGYTYDDAPHVCPDGRIYGLSQAPEYYAYSPPRTDSWEDGLQEIENFDWCAEKDVEEHNGEKKDQNGLATGLVDSMNESTTAVSSHSNENKLCVHEDLPTPDTKLDDPVQTLHANHEKPFTTDPSHTPPPSPLWVPSPVHNQASIDTTTHPQSKSNEQVVTEFEYWDSGTLNDMAMDDVSMISEFNNLSIVPRYEDDVISTHGNSPGEQIQQDDSNAQIFALVDEEEPEKEIDVDEGRSIGHFTAPTVVEALEDVQPTATSSQGPSEESNMSSLLQTQIPPKEDHCQPQSEVSEIGNPKTVDEHSQDTTPVLTESHSRNSPTEDVLHAMSEVTVPVEPEFSRLRLKETASLQLPGDVARTEMQAHDPWQVQLQDAVDDVSSEYHLIRRSISYHEHSVEAGQTFAVESKDEHADTSFAPASPLLKQHTRSDVVLPPSPFQPNDHDADHPDTKEAPTKATVSRKRKPRTVSSDDTATTKVPQPNSPTSPEKTKASKPRKRSRPAKKAKSASESDSDIPLKKKPRKRVPTKDAPNRMEHSGESFEEGSERKKLVATMGRKTGRSVKEEPQLDETSSIQALSKQASPTPFEGPSASMELDADAELQEPDVKANYSDAEMPKSCNSQTHTQARSTKSASARKPRPTARQLFANTSSPKSLEESPSVPFASENTAVIDSDDAGKKGATPIVSKTQPEAPAAKNRISKKATKTKIEFKKKEKTGSELDGEDGTLDATGEDSDAISSAPSTLESPTKATRRNRKQMITRPWKTKRKILRRRKKASRTATIRLFNRTPKKPPTTTNPKPEPKAKKNKGTRETYNGTITRSRTNTPAPPPPPARPVVSHTPLPAPRTTEPKYGFSNRKTRQSVKAEATASVAASVKAKAKARGKGKGKGKKVVDEDVDVEMGEGEGEGTEKAQEEGKNKVDGKAKAKGKGEEKNVAKVGNDGGEDMDVDEAEAEAQTEKKKKKAGVKARAKGKAKKPVDNDEDVEMDMEEAEEKASKAKPKAKGKATAGKARKR